MPITTQRLKPCDVRAALVIHYVQTVQTYCLAATNLSDITKSPCSCWYEVRQARETCKHAYQQEERARQELKRHDEEHRCL